MSYRPYPPPTRLHRLYDPVADLPPDHLARWVEAVVEEAVTPPPHPPGRGQSPYDPRLTIKVLVYGYATGTRSSRQLARLCRESLPYLFLTRGDAPSHTTLCDARRDESAGIEAVWLGLFAVADRCGLKRLGHVVVDSSKFRANASDEAVLTAAEYEAMRAELQRVLAEAEAVDEREAATGPRLASELGEPVPREQMRDLVRRVRKLRAQAQRPEAPAPAGEAAAAAPASSAGAAPTPRRPVSARMRAQLRAALVALALAIATGRKHLCLTDPDAEMMGEGRTKRVQECHSFEVVVDQEAGLLVVGQTTQAGNDNARLEPLVAAAQAHEPDGVKAADGDCGYYSGDALARLIRAGIDTCVPDTNTACDLHRGQPIGTTRARTQGEVPLTYVTASDRYVCPEGNELRPRQQRQKRGQWVTIYRAVRDCRGCPRAGDCLQQATAARRTLCVGREAALLEAARQRFAETGHQERYHHRGEVVESVFGFIRAVLGYHGWLLRGRDGVACEGRLFKVAYQVRKVHAAWAAAGAR
jgi:transposase